MSNKLEAWIQRAKQTDAAPGPQSSTQVRVTGDPLSKPLLWVGRQWAVTAHGVEARDGTYAIEGKRVWENENTHGWVEHMEEKEWVDMPDFVEALRIARKRWTLPDASAA